MDVLGPVVFKDKKISKERKDHYLFSNTLLKTPFSLVMFCLFNLTKIVYM